MPLAIYLPAVVRITICALLITLGPGGKAAPLDAAATVSTPSSASTSSLAYLINRIRDKAKVLESSAGMKAGFQSFISAHQLSSHSIRYSDYVVMRLLFEATRDAGFWNLRWAITDRDPHSEAIWRQWQTLHTPAARTPTATAECDEISALYAFLARHMGIKEVGLLWPTANHTVAVWTVRPVSRPAIRVIVPTTQIFLDENDFFDTRKFDPWRQKNIYDYTRRDVPDSIALPPALVKFFLVQIDKYAGASDTTLQQLRYLREGIFRKSWTPEQAAREADKKRIALPSESVEDRAAFQHFASDNRINH